MPHQSVLDELALDLSTHGYSIPAFGADISGLDWAHSIGLHHSYGHPELIVIGLDMAIGGAVIDVLARQVVEGRIFTAGDVVSVIGGHLVHFEEVDEIWCAMGDWFAIGREVLGERGHRWPPTLQVVWENALGERPLVPGDPAWQFHQPLLQGPKATA